MRKVSCILVLGIALVFLSQTWVINAEDTGTNLSKTDKDKTETPQDLLKKTAESYYDIKEQGTLRYACFITAPEIAKSMQLRSKIILEQVDFELIWEVDKPIKVKPREIPPFFGEEGREDALRYAKIMETTLTELFYTTNPVPELVDLIKTPEKLNKFSISSSMDKNLTKIEIAPLKVPQVPKRKTPRPNLKRKPIPSKGPIPSKDTDESDQPEQTEEIIETKAIFGSLIIWVNKDNEMTQFEISTEKEKRTGIIVPQKYNKLWNIKQLAITKTDAKEGFLERIKIDYNYNYPQNIMLPSSITITNLDEDNKVLVRRNEVNPRTINFNKYEVEKRKEKK